MITSAELHRIAEKEGLRFDQTEKDYVIPWLLSGLAHSGHCREKEMSGLAKVLFHTQHVCQIPWTEGR